MYQKGTLYASVQVLGKYPSVITVHHAGEGEWRECDSREWKKQLFVRPFSFLIASGRSLKNSPAVEQYKDS